MENALVTAVSQAGLAEARSEQLLKSFGGFFADAKKIASEAKVIIVTEESQTGEMKKARELRLQLRDIRTKGVEATRVQLKEQSVREGKAIDGIANVIKALIIPVEEHLEKQEKFAELLAEARKEQKIQERLLQLAKYSDNDQYSDRSIVANLSDESFSNYLETIKSSYKAKKEAEEKVESDRIAEEKAEAIENERIRIENVKLRKEAEERERREEAQTKLAEAEIAKERAKTEAMEKVISDAKEKKEQEERDARIKIETEQKAKDDAEKAKALAPDKEKLQELATTVSGIQMPMVTGRQSRLIITEVDKKLQEVAEYIISETKKL